MSFCFDQPVELDPIFAFHGRIYIHHDMYPCQTYGSRTSDLRKIWEIPLGNLCGPTRQKSFCQWFNIIKSSQNDLPSDPWTFASVSLFNSSKIVGLVAYSSTKGHSKTTYNIYIYIDSYIIYMLSTPNFTRTHQKIPMDSHYHQAPLSSLSFLCLFFFDPGYHGSKCPLW